MKHSILCVDDESDNVDALERLFRRQYNVLKATSAAQALEILAKHPVTVIISDQRMPQMSGVEFLTESQKTHPLAIRILLTGFTDIESVIAAINKGHIYRYVTKPWDPVDLLNAVDKAVERYEIGELLKEKNQALELALAELKTLDEAKSNFMLLINHELKTPLTSIINFSELLAETTLDDDQKKFLARIKSSTLRLHELVNDTLELVSAETGQLRISAQIFKPESLLTGVLNVSPSPIHDLAQKRSLQIQTSFEPSNLISDEKLLRSILRRLLHNAVKFADPSSVVELSGKIDAQNPSFYIVQVRNAGPPIDPNKLRQIFKPFVLNESILNHSTGTGLGLSVCQAILRQLGSKLDLSCADHRVLVSFAVPISDTRTESAL